ncbi:MAG: aminotransferase class IV [Xanthomonadales bacterium]|nr:aminotransferase class IV [Xanthomonadales bacterium]
MTPRIEINGLPADAPALAFLAQVNYGHFTSMQVRDGRVQGIEWHLDRLERGTRRLFGIALDRDCVRAWMRQAVGGGSASLRVTVFSRHLDRARLERPVEIDVLVAAQPARAPERSPLRARSVVHERALPEVKHVGTFDLLHHWREARLAGFDDVVFTTRTGAIAEGSIWNIGFWDGEAVILPDAPSLHGVTSRLVEAGLATLGVPCRRREVRAGAYTGLVAAFAMNSGSAYRPIVAIDECPFADDPRLAALIDAACATQPWEAL